MASIRKYKNRGDKRFSYEYRIKYIDPQTGKEKEKSKRGFSSSKEAEIAALEIERMLFLGDVDVVKNMNITIKEWASQYLELYGGQLRESTLRTRKIRIDKHIIPQLGNLKLQKITRLQYQKFINVKLEELKQSTVRSIHGTIMVIINKAVEHDIIDRNKLKGISISKDDDEEKVKFLTREKVTLFLNAAKQFPYDEYVSVFILLRTGLRKGELLGLTWGDVDFEKQLIKINKSRSHLGTFPPKTKKSNREISIDNRLTEELKSLQLWHKKNKLKLISYHESNYVVVDEIGLPYHEWRLNKILNDMKAEASTVETPMDKISPHSLRHTHAVMLLESGVNIKAVSDRLGHTTINMTADVYLHVSRKQEDEAVLKLERYLE